MPPVTASGDEVLEGYVSVFKLTILLEIGYSVTSSAITQMD